MTNNDVPVLCVLHLCKHGHLDSDTSSVLCHQRHSKCLACGNIICVTAVCKGSVFSLLWVNILYAADENVPEIHCA